MAPGLSALQRVCLPNLLFVLRIITTATDVFKATTNAPDRVYDFFPTKLVMIIGFQLRKAVYVKLFSRCLKSDIIATISSKSILCNCYKACPGVLALH
ncbi:hypothetical protein MPH_09169 [Macrophomina phaseolina MS6]|uniref:Secreted protein n=1 Tax=Macrophomina phaseolina (strain MS6) TaxID=1126212 RepID=K2RGH2_MACPH|nr:hypothetical protein MPH_09169 [Macrophomina phaseolina MS6]